MLRLENARHAIHDRYPCLELEIEGRLCRIIAEHKPPFYDAGLVFVGEEFSDICPPVTIRPYGGPPQTFRGFCSDPRLFRLWHAFLDVEDFREGPVPVPD